MVRAVSEGRVARLWSQKSTVVGVMDANGDTYTEVGTVTGGTATADFFQGGVAFGTKAYFAPWVRPPRLRTPKQTRRRTSDRMRSRTCLHVHSVGL